MTNFAAVDQSQANIHELLHNHDLGMYRYANLLEISQLNKIQSYQSGGTPIIRVKKEKSPFLSDVFIKDEGRNFTHSICDRIACFAAHLAKTGGFRGVSAYSSSKIGVAIAAAATSMGLESHFFIIKGMEHHNLDRIRILGGKIHELPENLDEEQQIELYQKTRTDMKLYDADGSEAKRSLATIAFEIAEQLGGGDIDTIWGRLGMFSCPDFIFVEEKYSSEILLGFKIMRERKILDKLPQIIGFNGSKCQKNDLDNHRPGYEIEEMAKISGILSDPAAAVGWKCVALSEKNGTINQSHSVVIINTSNGLNDVNGILKSMEGVGVSHVISSIDDVQ